MPDDMPTRRLCPNTAYTDDDRIIVDSWICPNRPTKPTLIVTVAIFSMSCTMSGPARTRILHNTSFAYARTCRDAGKRL